jgi:hypothetical protein
VQGFELKSDLRLDREAAEGVACWYIQDVAYQFKKINQEMKQLQVTKFIVNDFTLHLLSWPPSIQAD